MTGRTHWLYGPPTGSVLQRFCAAGLVLALSAAVGHAEQRFSQPQFEGGHTIPPLVVPPLPADVAWRYLDVAVLAAALGLGAWLVHRRRSRAGIFTLMLACLAYFGFVRKGCICPVGSVQNVVLGLCDASYRVPLHVVLLFLLPLVTALFFGRVFCGAVCPLGAIQELMVIGCPKPLPRWLAAGLSLFRYLYFGMAALLAALGVGFIICRFDPFVGFFRLGGNATMLMVGGALLGIGVFVARPYCRFLCPYGVLLELASRVSWRRVRITPDDCVTCGLCTDACPFDAIDTPSTGAPPQGRSQGRTALAWRLALLPALLGAGFLLGRAAAPSLAELHPTVRLAVAVQTRASDAPTDLVDAVTAFDENGGDPQALRAEAVRIVARFQRNTPWLGLFIGLVAGLQLVGLATYRTRTLYEPHSGRCLACARCYGYCPVDRTKGARHGSDTPAV